MIGKQSTGRPSASSGAPSDAPFVALRFPRLDLLDHLFIIRALILHDLRLQHLKTGNLGFWSEFLMPIVVITLHYFIFLALKRHMPAGMPVELFLLGGFTTWFVFRNTSAIVTRPGELGPGMLFIPGVTPTHFLVAAAAWECAAMSFVMALGLLLSESTFGNEPLPRVPLMMLMFLIAAALGTGYRLVFEALGWVWPFAKSIKKPMTWLLFLTSGIYFAAQGTRGDFLTKLAWFNPLIHIIETQRLAIYPGYPVAHVTLLYSVAWALGLMLAGLLLHRWLRRSAQR